MPEYLAEAVLGQPPRVHPQQGAGTPPPARVLDVEQGGVSARLDTLYEEGVVYVSSAYPLIRGVTWDAGG